MAADAVIRRFFPNGYHGGAGKHVPSLRSSSRAGLTAVQRGLPVWWHEDSVNRQAISSKDLYQRHAHTSSHHHVSSATLPLLPSSFSSSRSTSAPPAPMPPFMSILPLSTLIRSYLVTAVSSSPVLLRPCLNMLHNMAHSQSTLLNPDRNPALRLLLKKTFYAQFCAGESPAEIKGKIAQLKEMGYGGVILGYAREAVLDDTSSASLASTQDDAEKDTAEIESWEHGTLETVRLTSSVDFVALKFTGAGSQALRHLQKNIACASRLEEAVHKICRLARERGVRLLFDAEQISLQKGIDAWTLYFMKQYNTEGKALVYGTYQAYLRRTPSVLSAHLDMARREGWRLGVKLVRGAYLGSDPRSEIWASIEETHAAYNEIAESLIRRRWGSVLQGEGEVPEVDLVLASHNKESVDKARGIRQEQAGQGEKRIEMAYGQLMGMADHISCELVMARKVAMEGESLDAEVPRPYKYLVWGTVGECVKYLLRRARENREAVARTVEGRKALGKELLRRMGWGS